MAIAFFLHRGPGLPKLILLYSSCGRAKEKDRGELPTERDASLHTLFPVRPTVLFRSYPYWPYDLRQITQLLQPTSSLVGLPRETYSVKWR